MFVRIKKHILLTTIIFIVIGVVMGFLLSLFHLRFRFFVLQGFILVSFIGIVAGIIQLISRLDNKHARRGYYVALFATLLGLFVWIWLPLLLFFWGNYEKTEYLYDEKYSAHYDEFLDVYIYYYDYKNFFISGTDIRYEDDYPGAVMGDPIRYRYNEDGTIEVIMGHGG
jgi:hypothetical protein